jgi:MFS family permease
MRSNFRHLYADIFWYGVLAGSTVAYLSIYATRLGASGFQISLLTAAPAVVNLLFSLPAGRWLERLPLVRVSFRSAALHRLGYLVLIPLPWLFPEQGQIRAIVFVTFLMSIPGTLMAISFNALLAEVVPPDWRAEVVGRRNALLAISMTGATLLCGQLLDNIAFPLNYQVVFGIGFVGAVASTYHLSRLHLSKWVESTEARLPSFGWIRGKGRGLLGIWRIPDQQERKPLLQLELLHGTMGKFMFSYLVFYTFQYIPLPIFPLAYVRLLHLTDGVIEPLAQVRSKHKAIARMLEVAEGRLGGKRMEQAAVLDVDSPEEGDAIAAQIRERFGVPTVYRTTVSPAIGTHAGPGTVGMAFYAER